MSRRAISSASTLRRQPDQSLPGPVPQSARQGYEQPHDQPVTEAFIVAMGRMSGAMLLVRPSNEGTNLLCRYGERALMVRLVSRHRRSEKFDLAAHAVLP